MRFITDDGLSLEYEVDGAGHPIICLPGLTRNAEDFAPFVKAFAGHAQIIRITFRGRMPSDYDANWQNYNIWREGQDTVALLNHLKIDKALWLGTSRGGLVTMAMASEYHQRIAGAVLNDIGPELEPEGLSRIFDYLGVQPRSQNLAELAQALKRNMGAQFPTLSMDDWRELAKRWFVVDDSGVHLAYDKHLRDAVLATHSNFDWWRAFNALSDVPLGVIRGENSDLLSEAGLEKMHQQRDDLLSVEIADRGHVPFLDEPEAIDLIKRTLDWSFR